MRKYPRPISDSTTPNNVYVIIKIWGFRYVFGFEGLGLLPNNFMFIKQKSEIEVTLDFVFLFLVFRFFYRKVVLFCTLCWCVLWYS